MYTNEYSNSIYSTYKIKLSALHFRERATRIQVGGCPDLLWHSFLRRDWEGQEDQVRGPAEPHRRHHGTSYWLFHHQWHRNHLLSLQVDIIAKFIYNSWVCLQAGRLLEDKREEGKILDHDWKRLHTDPVCIFEQQKHLFQHCFSF